MTFVDRWLSSEPDAGRPPVRVRRDWALAAVVAAVTVTEVVARGHMVGRPLGLLVGFGLTLTMLWRRTRPLAMVAFGFGAFIVLDVATLLFDAGPFTLFAGGFVVVLIYSLFRWGSTRHIVIGSLIALAGSVLATASDFTGFGEAIGGLGVLLFAAALGTAVRYRHIVRTQQFEQVRFMEREMLARELHDTVAHHVSAIAIQAQAGQIFARNEDLTGATGALRSVEEQASRTLAEMRAMVKTLRSDDGHEAPSPRGVADIDSLASLEGAPNPRVEVHRSGDLTALPPSVQATLYRVAQEAVTNAARHAQNATRVDMLVTADTEVVTLRVTDDGDTGSSDPASWGYGLVGMAERVKLVGGTLQVGPDPEGGWTVEAVIPRSGDRP